MLELGADIRYLRQSRGITDVFIAIFPYILFKKSKCRCPDTEAKPVA
jgi:hypothetical protein